MLRFGPASLQSLQPDWARSCGLALRLALTAIYSFSCSSLRHYINSIVGSCLSSSRRERLSVWILAWASRHSIGLYSLPLLDLCFVSRLCLRRSSRHSLLRSRAYSCYYRSSFASLLTLLFCTSTSDCVGSNLGKRTTCLSCRRGRSEGMNFARTAALSDPDDACFRHGLRGTSGSSTFAELIWSFGDHILI